MYGKLAIASVDVWIRYCVKLQLKIRMRTPSLQSREVFKTGGTRPLRRCLDPPLLGERPYSHKDCGKAFSQGSPCTHENSLQEEAIQVQGMWERPVLLSLGRHLQNCLRRGTSRQPVKRVCRDKHSSGNHMLKTTCMICSSCQRQSIEQK